MVISTRPDERLHKSRLVSAPQLCQRRGFPGHQQINHQRPFALFFAREKLYPFMAHFQFYIPSSPYCTLLKNKFYSFYIRFFVSTSAKTPQHELASANTLMHQTHTLPLLQKQPWTWLINKQAGPSKGGRNLHRPCSVEEKSDTASQARALALAAAAAAAAHPRCFSCAKVVFTQT